jgi:hypothetical protein
MATAVIVGFQNPWTFGECFFNLSPSTDRAVNVSRSGLGPWYEAREVRMVEITEVLRLWLDGIVKKGIAARLGLDSRTVRRYITTAEATGLTRGTDALAEMHIGDVLVALHSAGVRPRGHGRARCREQHPTIGHCSKAFA